MQSHISIEEGGGGRFEEEGEQRLEPQTMEFWQLPEAGKSKAQIIPITTRSMALMTP